jgi:hypothetical protein
MYAFLFLLGAVITAAGLGSVASGVSIQDHTFDATNITPAVNAVIGGCIIIGLSFVVRALQRVERALTTRQMPRLSRPIETASGEPLTAQSAEPARIPFPPKPKMPAFPQAVPAGSKPAAVAAKSPDSLLEPVPLVVEEPDLSILPKPPVQPEEGNGDLNHGPVSRPNGAAQVKTAQRLGVGVRPARKPLQPKDSIFGTLWPKASVSAPIPEANLATTPQAQAAPPAPAQPSNGGDVATLQASPAEVREESAQVSILKSGVVEGMAYTLYSDGSIEAKLPGGTVRFGSITELRNHIEKNA